MDTRLSLSLAAFPLLIRIGTGAFREAGTLGRADSTIELVDGLASTLTTIESNAFRSFFGKLTFSGSFPLLNRHGYQGCPFWF